MDDSQAFLLVLGVYLLLLVTAVTIAHIKKP